MKTMNLKVLGMLLALQASGVMAADQIVEQINVTQDAVRVAQEELEQGKLDIQPGADTDIKLTQFASDASKALVRFEEAVRVRVLQSFSVLVSQYERAYKNKALGEARGQILESLLNQIRSVEKDKSQIYREAYLELYSVLPNLPISYDRNSERGYENVFYTKNEWKQENGMCMDSILDCKKKVNYTYSGAVYMAKSKTQNIKDFTTTDNLGARTILKSQNIMTMERARTELLQDCYTSVCYFMTQSRYTIWKTMVEASLARDIEIKLYDGNKITITKNVSRFQTSTDVLELYLNNIITEGVINNLPVDASPERVKTLSQMNAHLKNGSCSKARKLGETLCQTTREGCLMASEVALFKDRFGSDASCLK
jgi:hypothetical protein